RAEVDHVAVCLRLIAGCDWHRQRSDHQDAVRIVQLIFAEAGSLRSARHNGIASGCRGRRQTGWCGECHTRQRITLNQAASSDGESGWVENESAITIVLGLVCGTNRDGRRTYR